MEWKAFSHAAFLPPTYTNMEVSADGEIWIGKYKKSAQTNNLRAGYTKNINALCLDYATGPSLSSYMELLFKVKTIIGSRPPDQDAFWGLPPKTNGAPYYQDSLFLTRLEKSIQEAKKPVKKERKAFSRKPGKGLSAPVAPAPQFDLIENKTLNTSLGHENDEPPMEPRPLQQEEIAQSPTEEEEKPLKVLPMTEEDFFAMLGGVKFAGVGRRTRVDYDFKVSVIKSKTGEQKGAQYRIDFGAYFTENAPDFSIMCAGQGAIEGKWEELLFFNNPLFKESVKISGYKDKKMPKSFSNSVLVLSIIADLDLQVSAIAGSTTSFKWDVFPIEVPKMPNTTFKLINMKREAYTGNPVQLTNPL